MEYAHDVPPVQSDLPFGIHEPVNWVGRNLIQRLQRPLVVQHVQNLGPVHLLAQEEIDQRPLGLCRHWHQPQSIARHISLAGTECEGSHRYRADNLPKNTARFGEEEFSIDADDLRCEVRQRTCRQSRSTANIQSAKDTRHWVTPAPCETRPCCEI